MSARFYFLAFLLLAQQKATAEDPGIIGMKPRIKFVHQEHQSTKR